MPAVRFPGFGRSGTRWSREFEELLLALFRGDKAEKQRFVQASIAIAKGMRFRGAGDVESGSGEEEKDQPLRKHTCNFTRHVLCSYCTFQKSF